MQKVARILRQMLETKPSQYAGFFNLSQKKMHARFEKTVAFANKHTRVLLSTFVVVIVASSLLFVQSSFANVAMFYPSTCEGGWKNPNNAVGQPSLAGDPVASQYNDVNSAVLDNTHSALRCGNFFGSIPGGATPKSFTVKLHWTIDEGSVVHDGMIHNESFLTPTQTTPSTEAPVGGSMPNEEAPTVTAPADENSTDENTSPATVETPVVDEQLPTVSGEESSAETPVVAEPETQQAPESAVTTPEVAPAPVQEAAPAPTPEPAPAPAADTGVQASLSGFFSRLSKNVGSLTALVLDGVTGGSSIPPSTEDALEVRYTIDGTTWINLGTISPANWENKKFTIINTDASEWGNLSNFKIGVFSLSTEGTQPVVHIDAISLEVGYDTDNTTSVPTVKVEDPSVGILTPEKQDFTLDESPSFSLVNPKFTTDQIIGLVRENKATVLQDKYGVLADTGQVLVLPVENKTPTEETPAPTPTEETPAPVEETPAPTPTEETPAPVEETPAPTPTEETPAPTPTEETPAPTPTEETPAPAPTEETPAPVEETPAAPVLEQSLTNLGDAVASALGAYAGGAKIVKSVPTGSFIQSLSHFKNQVKAAVASTISQGLLALAGDAGQSSTIDAVVLDSLGRQTTIPVSVERVNVDGEEETVVRVKKPDNMFVPGRYTLRVTLYSSEANLVSEQDFSWGVLALNVDRSIYKPNASAYVQMGVIDDLGHTVCGAALTLVVTDPSGDSRTYDTANGDITREAQCGPDNRIDVPDYYMHLPLGTETGVYSLFLTATTDNGPRSVRDSFEVRSSVSFDVKRTGPTRIYPVDPYPVTMKIVSDEDWKGTVVEKMPDVFVPSVSSEGAVSYSTTETVGDVKMLYWNLDLKAGVPVTIGYDFLPPPISPEFYLLGPLAFYDEGEDVHTGTPTFKELRRWQIANDAVCTALASGSWATAGTWTCGHVPNNSDSVVINSGAVVTLAANTAVSILGIQINGTLDTSASNYTISTTTLDIGATGTLIANASAINITGASTSGTLFSITSGGVFTAGTSTVSFTGAATSGAQMVGGTGTFTGANKFNLLVINNASFAAPLGANIEVGGGDGILFWGITLTAGTFNTNSNAAACSGTNYNFTTTGYYQGGGTFNACGSTMTMNLSTGTGYAWRRAAGTFNPGTSTAHFTTTATFQNLNFTAETFYNVNTSVTSGSGMVRLGNALTIASSGTLHILQGKFANNNQTISGAATNVVFQMDANTEHVESNNFTMTNFTNANMLLDPTSTIHFLGGTAISLTPPYQNVIMDSSIGYNQFAVGNVTIAGNFAFNGLGGSGFFPEGNMTVGGTYSLTNVSGGCINYFNGSFGTYNLTAGNIVIGSSCTLRGPGAAGKVFTLTGSSGTLFVNNGTFTAGWEPGFAFTGNGSATLFGGTAVGTVNGDFTLAPTLTSGVGNIIYTLGVKPTTFSGNFTMNPSGSANSLTFTLPSALTIPATKTLTVKATGGSASAIFDTSSSSSYALSTGLFVVDTGGTLNANASAISVTATTGTTMTQSGTGVFSSGTSTVNSSGNGTATLNTGAFTGSNKFYNLTISSGTKSLGAAIEVANALVLSGGTFDTNSSSSYAVTAGTISHSGTAILGRTSTITLTGTTGPLITIASGGVSLASANFVVTSDAAVTVFFGTVVSLNNLTFSPVLTTSRAYTMGSMPTIGGDFTMNPSGTGTLTYTLGSNFSTIASNKSIIVKGTGGALAVMDTSGLNYSLATVGNIDIELGGTFNANASTIGITNDLLIGTSTNGGTFDAMSSTTITIGRFLTISSATGCGGGACSGGTLLAKTSTITLNGSSTNSATTPFTVASGGTLNVTGGASTITYQATSGTANVIGGSSVTYYNLIMATTQTLTGNITALGQVRVGSGASYTACATVPVFDSVGYNITAERINSYCNNVTTSVNFSTSVMTMTGTTGYLMPLYGTATSATYKFTGNATMSYATPNFFANNNNLTGNRVGNLIFQPTLTTGVGNITYTLEPVVAGMTVSGSVTLDPQQADGGSNTLTLIYTTVFPTISSANTITIKATNTNGSGATGIWDTGSLALSTGHMLIDTGGQLIGNSSAITVTGTTGTLWTCNGTFTVGSTSTTFNGAANSSQLMTAGTNVNFNNVTVNNTSFAAPLGANTTIAGTLTITLGTVDLSNSGNYTLTTGFISVASSASAILNLRGGTLNMNGTGSGTLLAKGASGVFTSGTSTVVVKSPSGTPSIANAALTFYKLWVDTGASVVPASTSTQLPSTYILLGSASLTVSATTGTQDMYIVSGTLSLGADTVQASTVNLLGTTTGQFAMAAGAKLMVNGCAVSGLGGSACNTGSSNFPAYTGSWPAASNWSLNPTSTVVYFHSGSTSSDIQTVNSTPVYGNVEIYPIKGTGKPYSSYQFVGTTTIAGNFTFKVIENTGHSVNYNALLIGSNSTPTYVVIGGDFTMSIQAGTDSCASSACKQYIDTSYNGSSPTYIHVGGNMTIGNTSPAAAMESSVMMPGAGTAWPTTSNITVGGAWTNTPSGIWGGSAAVIGLTNTVNLTVGGNFTQNGTFTSTTSDTPGTVTLNKATTSTVSGSGTKTFYNLSAIPNFIGRPTVSATTPAVITMPGHGLSIGDPVYFTASAMPTGMNAGVTYYVVATGFSNTQFEVSTTPGGGSVAASSTGTAVVLYSDTYAGKDINFTASQTFTVSNAFTVTGRGGALVKLFSTTPTSTWTLVPPVTANNTVDYADVQDSSCSSASSTKFINATHSTDDGNNSLQSAGCWSFGQPYINMSISSNIIELGRLGSAAARYGTPGAGSGGSATDPADSASQKISVATSGSGGYNLYVQGESLSNGSHTIQQLNSGATSSTPGTEQFGIRVSASGGLGTATIAYSGASTFALDSTAAVPSMIAQLTSSSLLTTDYYVHYLANINGSTPTGSYVTNLTYVVVANF